jgi:hypothetical protein
MFGRFWGSVFLAEDFLRVPKDVSENTGVVTDSTRIATPHTFPVFSLKAILLLRVE